MVNLQSDVALVPKDPSPAPQRNLSKTVPCPLCWARQEESHYCAALGRSEVILAVGYTDSEMRLILTP